MDPKLDCQKLWRCLGECSFVDSSLSTKIVFQNPQWRLASHKLHLGLKKHFFIFFCTIPTHRRTESCFYQNKARSLLVVVHRSSYGAMACVRNIWTSRFRASLLFEKGTVDYHKLFSLGEADLHTTKPKWIPSFSHHYVDHYKYLLARNCDRWTLCLCLYLNNLVLFDKLTSHSVAFKHNPNPQLPY